MNSRTRQNPKNMPRDPLGSLSVIETLEVGPVRLEPKRLKAAYRVTQDNKTDEMELIYGFEEEVFTPGEAASTNLAAMVAAQVALNYGLFCKEIVFHGPFTPEDRQFLKDMASNTAREIFVKKFLEPNPFLRGTVTDLPPVRLEDYLRKAQRV